MYKFAIAILAALCVVSTNAAAPVRQRTKTVHKSIAADEQYDPYIGISQHRRAMEDDHSMSMMDHHDDHSMSMKDDDHEGHDHGEDDHSDDKDMVEEASR